MPIRSNIARKKRGYFSAGHPESQRTSRESPKKNEAMRCPLSMETRMAARKAAAVSGFLIPLIKGSMRARVKRMSMVSPRVTVAVLL